MVLALVACSGDAPPGPVRCSGFVGDPARPIELEVAILGASGTMSVATDGAEVPLVLPPQGGRVVFVGVRARNLDTCAPELIGALRDPDTGRVVGLEGRPVNLTATADGWAEPTERGQSSSYANVAVCPNHGSPRDIQDQPYELSVQVKDRAGRTAEKKLKVTPVCTDPISECRCICSEGYVLGAPCGPDGGL